MQNKFKKCNNKFITIILVILMILLAGAVSAHFDGTCLENEISVEKATSISLYYIEDIFKKSSLFSLRFTTAIYYDTDNNCDSSAGRLPFHKATVRRPASAKRLGKNKDFGRPVLISRFFSTYHEQFTKDISSEYNDPLNAIPNNLKSVVLLD
jgi:hypothetical protein